MTGQIIVQTCNSFQTLSEVIVEPSGLRLFSPAPAEPCAVDNADFDATTHPNGTVTAGAAPLATPRQKTADDEFIPQWGKSLGERMGNLERDVASIKQDVAEIRQDVAEIKRLVSR